MRRAPRFDGEKPCCTYCEAASRLFSPPSSSVISGIQLLAIKQEGDDG
jgi:hypothetical protein